MSETLARLFALVNRPITIGFAVALLLSSLSAMDTSTVEAAGLRVSAQGECLRLRGTAGLSSSVVACAPDGSTLVAAGQQATADGLSWTLVRWGEVVGWAASQYLADEGAALPQPATVVATRATTTSGAPFKEPPAGGITVGLVSAASPRSVVAAQPFEVASLSVYDFATQRFLTYIPGSPLNAIGDDPLPAGSVVFIRAQGNLPVLPAPVARAITAGAPSVLATPGPGATSAGIAGTGEIAALIAAQPFAVESMSVWDLGSQRWLTYIANAPEFANTLKPGLLGVDSVVFVRRSAASPAAAPAPTPPVTTVTPAANAGLKTVSYGPASIMFYYCAPGARSGSVGDGGGFCGYMANGERVQPGAASCAAAYMGQRFLIAGDPLNRVYTCMDTGGAVTAGHRDIWFANADEGGDWWHVVGRTAEILVIVP